MSNVGEVGVSGGVFGDRLMRGRRDRKVGEKKNELDENGE